METAALVMVFPAGLFCVMTILGLIALVIWSTMAATAKLSDSASPWDGFLPKRAAIFSGLSALLASAFAGLHFFLRWLA